MDDDQQFTLIGNVLVDRQGMPRREIFRFMSREERALNQLIEQMKQMGTNQEVLAVLYLLRRAKDRLGDYLDKNTIIIND